MEKTLESPAGTYLYFRQYIHDIPVYATNFIVFVNKDNTVMYALNEFRNIAEFRNVSNRSSVKNNDALKIAYEYLNTKEDIIDNPNMELVYFESIDKGLELAWKIITKEWQIFVSAETGRIIHAESSIVSATGSGNVFKPSPLVSANEPYGYCCGSNNCLLHNGGATNSCLNNQLISVTLNDLTFENGLYKLSGPYALVVDIGRPWGHNIPELSTPIFNYIRDQEEFAAVMCYYHIDLSARRILELGYQIPDRLKNFRIDPHDALLGERNAFYSHSNYIGMGSGFAFGNTFVASAEDADIIWHEHGHAIHFNFGSPILSSPNSWIETVAVCEGSADYWASSYRRSLHPNNWVYGEWFAMGDPYYSRRVDLNWVYPDDLWTTPCVHWFNPCGHCAGQIWSSALMKIWGDLGRDITDKLFLEAHLLWGFEPSMRDAATAFMQADVHLHGGVHLCQIYTRFQEHGLIDSNNVVMTTSFVRERVTTDKIVFSCSDLDVQDVSVEQGGELILDAAGTTRIISNFKVELGSTLKIK